MINRFKSLIVITVIGVVSACAPNPVQVVTPISEAVVNANQVVGTEITIGETAAEAMAELEAKAVENRQEAGLAPVAENETLATRPATDVYSTLPFDQMFNLVIEDVTREWGLDGGREVRLLVTVDTIKMANTGMAMLFGSSDQLAGNVEVVDAATGQPLGEFYVDVINSHSGLFGMAIRGGGIRERLAEEFALQVSRQLTGNDDRPE